MAINEPPEGATVAGLYTYIKETRDELRGELRDTTRQFSELQSYVGSEIRRLGDEAKSLLGAANRLLDAAEKQHARNERTWLWNSLLVAGWCLTLVVGVQLLVHMGRAAHEEAMLKLGGVQARVDALHKRIEKLEDLREE